MKLIGISAASATDLVRNRLREILDSRMHEGHEYDATEIHFISSLVAEEFETLVGIENAPSDIYSHVACVMEGDMETAIYNYWELMQILA